MSGAKVGEEQRAIGSTIYLSKGIRLSTRTTSLESFDWQP